MFDAFDQFHEPLPHPQGGRRSGATLLLVAVLSLALPGLAQAQKAPIPPKATVAPPLEQSTKPAPLAVAKAYLVKVSRFAVSGGDKPGDTVTLSMGIDTSGDGSRDIPWSFSSGTSVIASGTEHNVGANKSIDVSATYRLPMTEGAVRFQGTVDAQNTLKEPDSERANNVSQVVEKAVHAAASMATLPATASKANGVSTMATATVKNPFPAPVYVQPAPVLGNTGKSVGVSATLATPVKADLKVNAVKSLALDANVLRGSSMQGTVTLDTPAPVTGLTVSLTSSSTALGVPQSVTIPGGSTTAAFTAIAPTTGQPGNAIVSAVVPGAGAISKQATVAVWGAEQVQSLTKLTGYCPLDLRNQYAGPSRNLQPGDTCRVRVALETSARTAGARALLGSSSSNVTLPASVSFTSFAGSGSSPAAADFDFVVAPGATPGPVTITATGDRPGGVPKQLTLTIDAIPASRVDNLGLPAIAEPGVTLAGRIYLNGAAEAGGINITLTSSSANVSVPASVNIPAGATGAPYTARVAPGAQTGDVVISGARSGPGNAAATQTLKISSVQVASVGIDGAGPGLGLRGAPVFVGVANPIKIRLDGIANSDVTVNLASSNTAVVVPASVTVPAGQTVATFSATSAAGVSSGDATVSAVRAGTGNVAKQFVVSLVLVQASSLRLAPATLTWTPKVGDSANSAAAVSTQATVTLDVPAPPGGVALTISAPSASNEGVSFPASVVVPAGQATATFTVTLGTRRPAARPAGSRSSVFIRAARPETASGLAAEANLSLVFN